MPSASIFAKRIQAFVDVNEIEIEFIPKSTSRIKLIGSKYPIVLLPELVFEEKAYKRLFDNVPIITIMPLEFKGKSTEYFYKKIIKKINEFAPKKEKSQVETLEEKKLKKKMSKKTLERWD